MSVLQWPSRRQVVIKSLEWRRENVGRAEAKHVWGHGGGRQAAGLNQSHLEYSHCRRIPSSCLGCWPLGVCEEGEGGVPGVGPGGGRGGGLGGGLCGGPGDGLCGRWEGGEGELCEEEFGQDHHLIGKCGKCWHDDYRDDEITESLLLGGHLVGPHQRHGRVSGFQFQVFRIRSDHVMSLQKRLTDIWAGVDLHLFRGFAHVLLPGLYHLLLLLHPRQGGGEENTEMYVCMKESDHKYYRSLWWCHLYDLKPLLK